MVLQFNLSQKLAIISSHAYWSRNAFIVAFIITQSMMPLQLTHVSTAISSRAANNCFKPAQRFFFPAVTTHPLFIVRSPYGTTFLIYCFLANRAASYFVCLSVCSSCLKTKFGQLSCLSCCCGRVGNFWCCAVVYVKRKENEKHPCFTGKIFPIHSQFLEWTQLHQFFNFLEK